MAGTEVNAQNGCGRTAQQIAAAACANASPGGRGCGAAAMRRGCDAIDSNGVHLLLRTCATQLITGTHSQAGLGTRRGGGGGSPTCSSQKMWLRSAPSLSAEIAA